MVDHISWISSNSDEQRGQVNYITDNVVNKKTKKGEENDTFESN